MLQSKVVCSPCLYLKPGVLTETVTIIFIMQHVQFYPIVSFYKWIYITMNYREKYEELIDHHSYTHSSSSCEIKAWKSSGLNGTRTHDLWDTSAVLYQLSSLHSLILQASCSLFAILNVHRSELLSHSTDSCTKSSLLKTWLCKFVNFSTNPPRKLKLWNFDKDKIKKKTKTMVAKNYI